MARLEMEVKREVEELTRARLGVGERRRIVRQLLARAARNPGPALPVRLLVEPVAEERYEHVLDRAFERACRLHERLAGREPAAPYSSPCPSGRNA